MPDQDEPTTPAPPEQPESPEPAEAPDWRVGIEASAGMWADVDPTQPAPVSPPAIDPARWEDFPTFRESFLRFFTNPHDNAALRDFGMVLFGLTLEASHVQPDEPEGYVRHDLRAALADLRALEGFLAYIGRGIEELDEEAPSFALAELAGELAPKVARIAATIEGALS